MRASRPSASAETVALARAHLHKANVIDDHLANAFLGRRRRLAALALQSKLLSGYTTSATFSFLAARTQFFDHVVRSSVDDGCPQVVILGAGYDTRAWRLAEGRTRFFEVDHPETQRRKRRLAPQGNVTYVAVDLRCHSLAEALTTAGFDSKLPSIIVVEGLTMYLTKQVTEGMFQALAQVAAPGSTLAALFSASGGGSVSALSRMIAGGVRLAWSVAGEPTFHWASREVTTAMLPRTGWTLREERSAPQLVRAYLGDTTMSLDGANPDVYCMVADRTVS